MLTEICKAVVIATGIISMFMALSLTLAAIQYLNKDDEPALCLRVEESRDVFTNETEVPEER